MLYNVRKNLAIRLNLRRIISGGRLYCYYKYAKIMSAQEYTKQVATRKLKDAVLSFQLKNEFKFIKVLPNYIYDVRSLNYASFIEWLNPRYKIL